MDQQPLGSQTEAFDQRYADWSGPVFRYLVHLLGPGPTTEDLFQETWMRVIEHGDQLRDAERFGAWILRIARNLAFNHTRGGRRRAQIWIFSQMAAADRLDGLDPLAFQADVAPGPREEAVNGERRRVLQRMLADLPPDLQEMLQLRYFQGLTLAEVARVMDLPLGTVCTRVHRTLHALRRRMERRGFIGSSSL